MKYLVLLVIVFAGIWWIRQQRRPDTPQQKTSGPQIMVACAHCGTHIPENEAIHGAQGVYCSQAHRDSHEG
ncbi:PP0621 family protein [Limnohabitans sp.]|uniref:PP0621 family protein n=1 Tax=Limnohabitans sp. TaxID=1907725 RepID=UPI00286F520D|nr:PP0621 family protein [Limnohabitans sp.]